MRKSQAAASAALPPMHCCSIARIVTCSTFAQASHRSGPIFSILRHSSRPADPRANAGSRRSAPLMKFDECGEPLYAGATKKGNRRYHYFVSRKLVRGSDQTEDRGWRLPAAGTEQAVMAATRQMLSDRGALASTLKARRCGAAELKQATETIDTKVKSIKETGITEDFGTAIE